MSKDKISSQEIIDFVSSKASVSKRAVEEFLKVLTSTIEEALIAGEVVKIKNFGTFKMQWNEPRKSVNVQTGEDIILPGFHKVTFTPDNQLRDLVNEPFAHLEPVELDGSPIEKTNTSSEPPLDPLRSLNEQAFEIRNILDEIRELSTIADGKVESIEIVEQEHTFELKEDVVEPIINSNIIESERPEYSVEETAEPIVVEPELPHQDFEEVDIQINFNPKSEPVVPEISISITESSESEPPLDPLRSLNEQAFEIRNILDEIRELSTIVDGKVESIEIVEQEHTFELREDVVEPIIDSYIIESERSEYSVEEISESIVVEPELSVIIEIEKVENELPHQDFEEVDIQINFNPKSEPVVPEISISITESSESEPELYESVSDQDVSIEEKKVKKRKHKKTWLIVILSLILLIFLGIGAYSFYPPARNFMDKNYSSIKFSVLKKSESISMTDMFNTVSGWFASKNEKEIVPQSIVIPKDTTQIDSIDAKPEVDSLQMLFDNPRVYTAYLGTERIHDGSRLAIMAKRYYGSKDFWVYIYEANREHIANPDRIPVGTLIKVPKVDKRLIDSSNERCIRKAKELHDIYVKRN